jgi:DegV family protein with EDD domain
VPTGNVQAVERVIVVTDSSTCLPADVVSAFDIRVLPISLHLPESLPAEESETGDESTWRLPKQVELEELSGANHPFVTEYLAAIEEPGYAAAAIVTPAIEFATMFRNAALACELASRPSIAIDARSAAAGQALVVLAGAQEAAKGSDLDTVVQAIEDASRRVELVGSLATLEPIRQSGPLPADVLQAGELIGMRSVFRMHEGTIEPIAALATTQETLDTIRSAFLNSAPHGAERCAVFHADVPELAERLTNLLGHVDFVSGFSLAMQVHTGRGVLGAAWIPK